MSLSVLARASQMILHASCLCNRNTLVVMYSSEESGAESVATRSSTVSPSSSLGRPRKSLVWNYFIYDDVSGKSICQVSTGESNEAGSSSSGPNVCGQTCAGKFPSN